MHEAEKLSLEQIAAFLQASEEIRFKAQSREQVYHWIEQLGAADKAVNLVGCKSPYHQLPVFGWLVISDACGGNKACSARIKASAALQGYCCGGNDLGGEQTRRDSVGINRHEAVMAEIIRIRSSEPIRPQAMRGRS